MKDLLRITLFLGFTVTFLVSCGKSPSGLTAETQLGNIIVGDVDWQDVRSGKSALAKNAAAVAHLDLPMLRSRCTGFLINETTILTNQHCIPSAFYARGVTATFKYEQGVSKSSHKKYDCDIFLGNDRALDYALLECRGLPGEEFGHVKLSTQAVAHNHNVYVIQQNCDYYLQQECDPSKKVSYGTIQKVADEYTHNADTLGGSSGSPVFSKTDNVVVGLHHAGFGNNGFGRGIENYAVMMDKVVKDIQKKYPEVSLTLAQDSSNQDNSQQYEPNNSFAQAKTLSSSFSVKGLAISNSKDYDFYKFYLSKTKFFSAKISFRHSEGDLDLYLLNSSKKIVAKSTSVNNVESIVKTLPAGKYYLVVLGYQGAKGEYDLTLQ